MGMADSTAFEIQFSLHPSPRPPRPPRVDAKAPVAESVRDGQLPRVTQMLALAISFQDMLGKGRAKDYADLARLGGVTRERMSQIMKLIWLASDIQVEILYLPPTPDGRYPVSELALREVANVVSWAEQRSRWQMVKGMHRLG